MFESEFTEEIKEMIASKVGHFVCYEVAFSESVSTTARSVFNASRNTPKGGSNLNDCLFRGTPYLTTILGPVMDAFACDIGQFYNAFLLDHRDIPYQKFLFKEGLNKKAKWE